MTPDALAALHALAFIDAPRPWSATEFAALLPDPAVVFAAEPDGFALGRLAGPEVEVLTLAVHPEARRRGLASRLLQRLETEAAARGAEDCFLEVAATNTAARALYAKQGYIVVGRRPSYYRHAPAAPVDALVLRKPLHARDGKTI
jgi:ribosomal-protein-alanine N-acetyltransferase